MRLSWRRWELWCLVAAVGGAVAYAAWPNRQPPLPAIPQPTGITEPEVQQLVYGASQKVEREPRSAEAWGEYGVMLRAHGQHAEADRCFEAAAQLDPSDGRWPYLIGHHLAESDPAAAIPWLERAYRGTVPAAAQDTVRARLAETLIAAGRPAEALAVLPSDPTGFHPRLRLAAARAAAATGDDRTAAEFLGDLADYPPAARQALLLRAEICRRQGRTAYADFLAARAADVPLATWPDPLDAWVVEHDFSRGGQLAQAGRLMREGRLADAEQIFRGLLGRSGRSDVRPYVGLAEARDAMGDRPAALAALAQAVKIDPHNLAANYKLGLFHFDSGEKLWAAGKDDAARAEFREAVTWLDKVLAGNPNYGKALLLKGAALQRFLDRPQEGLALLRRFVQLQPEAGEGHLLLGQALAESGQANDAAVELRRAVELAQPGDRRAAEALAKLEKR